MVVPISHPELIQHNIVHQITNETGGGNEVSVMEGSTGVVLRIGSMEIAGGDETVVAGIFGATPSERVSLFQQLVPPILFALTGIAFGDVMLVCLPSAGGNATFTAPGGIALTAPGGGTVTF
jgi:hypothetical protein